MSECQCAEDCKYPNDKNTETTNITPRIYKKNNVYNSKFPDYVGIPIAKQGGSSCYPSACMNEGECFSPFTPIIQTTTTTTASPNGQPICVKSSHSFDNNFIIIIREFILISESHVNHNFQDQDVKFIILNQFKIGIIFVVSIMKEICIYVKMVANACLFQTEKVGFNSLIIPLSNSFIN